VTASVLEERDRARETAEAALRASEERFRNLAESLPQLVWTSLPNGRVDYLNRRWLEYTGMSEGDPLDAHRRREVIHPDDLGATVACWDAAMEGVANLRSRSSDPRCRWQLPVVQDPRHTDRGQHGTNGQVVWHMHRYSRHRRGPRDAGAQP